MHSQLKSQLKSLPTEPGIYRFYDKAGQLLYVGKAKNLRNRVRSYFVDRQTSPKTKILVQQIDHLEFIIVASEIDALILEANLIKEYQPPYNIILKDDKSHVYIKITTYQDFPIISTCRQADMADDPKALYFGPYPSGRVVRQTLRYLRKVFPYLAHRPPVPPGRRRAGQSFFYYNLNLGQAEPADQWDKKEYRKQVYQFIYFLEGKRLTLMEELDKEMRQEAKKLNFEKAAELKQQYDNLAYLATQRISVDDYLQNPELIADKRQQALDELAQALAPHFPDFQSQQSTIEHPLHRIECYDISNIMGNQSVGSMVVFIEGQASKSHYRKFRIKQQNKPNDVAMVKEVLTRRLKRSKSKRPTKDEEGQSTSTDLNDIPQAYATNKPQAKPDASFSDTPSLIIVDGGKGQLSAALEVLEELELSIPVVGMTKREEELLLKTGSQDRYHTSGNKPNNQLQSTAALTHGSPNRSGAHGAIAKSSDQSTTQTNIQGDYTTIRLARGSEPLFLIQRIRDEAHRFAIQYHKQLRSKAFIPDKKK